MHDELLASICREWDRAEEDIKRAEQICQEIVIPSVNELRYAGRRLIDGLNAASKSPRDVEALFREASYFCHRARHDAIDAATAQIAIELDIMVDKLGHDVIVAAFPGYAVFKGHFEKIRDRIAVSRGQRENREAIYSTIEAVDFPQLAQTYRELKSCEPIMVSMAKGRRSREFAAYVVAAVSLAAAAIFWWYPRPVPDTSAHPNPPSIATQSAPTGASQPSPSVERQLPPPANSTTR